MSVAGLADTYQAGGACHQAAAEVLEVAVVACGTEDVNRGGQRE